LLKEHFLWTMVDSIWGEEACPRGYIIPRIADGAFSRRRRDEINNNNKKFFLIKRELNNQALWIKYELSQFNHEWPRENILCCFWLLWKIWAGKRIFEVLIHVINYLDINETSLILKWHEDFKTCLSLESTDLKFVFQ